MRGSNDQAKPTGPGRRSKRSNTRNSKLRTLIALRLNIRRRKSGNRRTGRRIGSSMKNDNNPTKNNGRTDSKVKSKQRGARRKNIRERILRSNRRDRRSKRLRRRERAARRQIRTYLKMRLRLLLLRTSKIVHMLLLSFHSLKLRSLRINHKLGQLNLRQNRSRTGSRNRSSSDRTPITESTVRPLRRRNGRIGRPVPRISSITIPNRKAKSCPPL